MKVQSTRFKNPINGEQWICENVRQTKVIDGQVYIAVHKPNSSHTVYIKKSSLEHISKFG